MAKIYATTNPEISEREKLNALRSQKAAAEGMVLLENNGVLPLQIPNKKIALFGNGARNTIKGGTGSGDVNSRYVVSIEEAFCKAGYEITTVSWMDRYEQEIERARKAYFERIHFNMGLEGDNALLELFLHPFQAPDVILAEPQELEQEDVDTAVFVVSRNSGEGADRKPAAGDFFLCEREQSLLDQITASYKNVIAVLNVGGVIDTSWFYGNDKISAVVLMSQAGVNGSNALVDVLTGKVTPGGHLTMTWAAKYEDYPCADTFSHMNGDTDDEYYNEGIYVGYRYFDTFNITPVYPFGYGKSYTDFSIATTDIYADEKEVSLSVRVTNTGDTYSGKQVVQVYVSAPAGHLEKPYQELKAFRKTKDLAPGETQKLTITFATVDLASYDEVMAAWILEKGDYYIRVGESSRATHITAKITLSETVIVRQLSNRLPLDCCLELKSSSNIVPYTYNTEKDEKTSAPQILLDASAFTCEIITYSDTAVEIPKKETPEKITIDDVKSGRYTLKDLVSQLTVEEMAELCVGTARGGYGASSIVGAASNAVPGAAGDTTSLMIHDRGIRNLILADGPAGLRLTPVFFTDSENNFIPGTEDLPVPGMENVVEVSRPDLPEDAITYYQYCTAIPIATLLAQSWNMEIIEQIGDLMGEEMEAFGVHLWLAPGMNIQRNPLCGRNFEYYSEDPLVAGKCAAETRGVQKHPGRGTTIKHYACNNQEENRLHTNAHVSERALREIFLKGFEIAIKESQPKSIMTSYNLINGIHAANNRDLITAIARDENGFQGIVMTDWGTTGGMGEYFDSGSEKYGLSSAAGCIMAGNDLTMPGKQEDVDEIIRSVENKSNSEDVDYPLTIGDLQSCALHILNTVLELA